MKDGRTHLADKAEHAIDLETGGMCKSGKAFDQQNAVGEQAGQATLDHRRLSND